MKSALALLIVVFVALEGWLATVAMSSRGSFAEAIALAFREPATWMMLVDFVLFAAIVFFWMVRDAKARGKNGWLWLPLLVLAPTVALAAFLLSRPISPPEGRPAA